MRYHLLGQTGLRKLALVNHANAVKLADMLAKVKGIEILQKDFFNEFTIRVPGSASALLEKLAARGILAGVPYSRLSAHAELKDLLIIASTEVNTDEDRVALVSALKELV